MIRIIGLLVFAAIVTGFVVWMFRRSAEKERRTSERRRRFVLNETDERVPLAQEKSRAASSASPADGSTPAAQAQSAPRPAASTGFLGRIVRTPEGEAVLTHPPFALREGLLSARGGRYFHRLSRRLPAWLIACPRVRLDAIVQPLSPRNRDAIDYAAWRRRARLRHVDILVCDRRTFRPVLAIVFPHAVRGVASASIAGGQDRMIDEILGAAGLPMLRVSGGFRRDWPLIAPHVEQAILASVSEDDVDRAHAAPDQARIRPEGAIHLLHEESTPTWQ